MTAPTSTGKAIDDAVDSIINDYREKHPDAGELELFTLIRAKCRTPQYQLPDLEISSSLNRTKP